MSKMHPPSTALHAPSIPIAATAPGSLTREGLCRPLPQWTRAAHNGRGGGPRVPLDATVGTTPWWGRGSAEDRRAGPRSGAAKGLIHALTRGRWGAVRLLVRGQRKRRRQHGQEGLQRGEVALVDRRVEDRFHPMVARNDGRIVRPHERGGGLPRMDFLPQPRPPARHPGVVAGWGC